jgi:hypothetical protein
MVTAQRMRSEFLLIVLNMARLALISIKPTMVATLDVNNSTR